MPTYDPKQTLKQSFDTNKIDSILVSLSVNYRMRRELCALVNDGEFIQKVIGTVNHFQRLQNDGGIYCDSSIVVLVKPVVAGDRVNVPIKRETDQRSVSGYNWTA